MTDHVELGRTTADELADLLRSMIRGGEFDVGERLPSQQVLADRHGVALASVREALRVLKAEGYVEIRRGGSGGTFVTGLEMPSGQWRDLIRRRLPDIGHVMDLRVAVEGHAAQLAAERHEPADLAELVAAVDEMAGLDGDTGFRRSDARFHNAVAAASHNPRIVKVVRETRGEIFLAADPIHPRYDVAASLGAHRLVLVAIEAGDGSGARAAMEAHIEHTRKELDEIARNER